MLWPSPCTDGRHYLRVGACDTGNSQAQQKFVVGHELGHALLALFYGDYFEAVDGGEPAVDWTHDVDPNACGMGGTFYSMGSKEWNSVAFREGFAHFMAAYMWNPKQPEGAFRWGNMYDLRRYDFGAGLNSGGRLKNECCDNLQSCAVSWENAGTNEDWMRFFWEWFNNDDAECQQQPNEFTMLDLYRETRLAGDDLTATNYYEKMFDAAQNLALPACLSDDRFWWYSVHHGVDY